MRCRLAFSKGPGSGKEVPISIFYTLAEGGKTKEEGKRKGFPLMLPR